MRKRAHTVMEIVWGPCVLVLKDDQQGPSLIGEAQYEGEAVWFTNSMGVLVSSLLPEIYHFFF